MRAKEPDFKDQFIGKKAENLEVTKTGASADNQIEAISGATITSRAVTSAVNSCVAYSKSLKGGN
jgi:electron transport complex protein RnfG